MSAIEQPNDSDDTRNEATSTSAADRRLGERRTGDIVDRRVGLDRRVVTEAEQTNLERRRGPGRRLSEFVRDAEEGEMNKEQFMFLMAIDAFKRSNGKSFPTWTDVLEVIRKLGYRKTMPSELNLGGRAEDWRERADAPSKTTHSSDAPAEGDRRRAA